MSALKPKTATNLSNLNGIKHGFFGRQNGVSNGIYDSLNCGFGSNDDPKNVKQNRTLVAQYFGIDFSDLQNPYQIHSNLAYYINEPFKKDGQRVDAYVTDVPKLAIGILTADCGPILFADNINKVIGAAHSGWQGAFSGIIESTIALMLEKGAQLENIKVAIGPCIEQKSYEVGPEYFERFISSDAKNEQFFTPYGTEGKYLFALKQYCAMRLQNAGIKNIEILEHDTCTLEHEFFSNRRRTKAGEPDYGRNISVIMIE
jgi:polyphenol oxidase